MAYTKKDVTNTVKKKNTEKNIKKNDDIKESKLSDDTTEVIDEEIMSKIEDEVIEDLDNFKKDKPTKEKKYSNKPNGFVILLIIITIISAGVFFVANIINPSSTVSSIISSSLLALFAIIYLVVCLTSLKEKTFPIIISSFLLIIFFIINIQFGGTSNTITNTKVINFSGKTLTDAVKWANNNNIKINQEYEYSDMIPEYEIISQSVKPGTNSHDIDEVTVAVSEGPNPYKEIIVPSMLTWDSERVIKYVLNNYLNNVIVDFVESDQVKDTVIEQSRSGNLRRNEELKLVFSYGDLGNSDEVTLIDFTNMSKFEIEFFMKQHHINYNFEYDFSDSIKKGYGISQSIESGKVVKVNGDRIIITISKGPKIEIPDLDGKSITEITEWAIENRLKLEFVDSYDDTIKKGKVISINQEKGVFVEQGTTIKVVVSLGSLKLPRFKTVDDFYKWADKYGIKYEEQHEFSDSVKAGEIISFNPKIGTILKNDQAITVVISDGVKSVVPNLIGLSKSNAIKKLNAVSLNYNFVYKNNTKAKDTVLGQSISAGSEVSSGTTITVTLSNGKAPSSGGNNNGGGNTPTPTPSPSPEPVTPKCESVKVYIYDELLNFHNAAGTCSNIKNRYPSLNFTCSYVHSDLLSTGIVQNSEEVDEVVFTTCDTIRLVIVNNNE